MTTLGEVLKNLRGKESLREAAQRAGVSHSYLRYVEKGVDPRTGAALKPSPETLKRLAKAYTYPYQQLMNMAGYSGTETGETETNYLYLFDQETLERFDELSEGDKLFIVSQFESSVKYFYNNYLASKETASANTAVERT
ncbi:helix-turn-helix domain-containing protein [Paenibacillus chitinolyticus]|uniref:helix-turn-helix domain-containing protein n=1 Tax=Paenibacillus chitinolyticus TaxID=79263 RepID=UPI0035E0AB38